MAKAGGRCLHQARGADMTDDVMWVPWTLGCDVMSYDVITDTFVYSSQIPYPQPYHEKKIFDKPSWGDVP